MPEQGGCRFKEVLLPGAAQTIRSKLREAIVERPIDAAARKIFRVAGRRLPDRRTRAIQADRQRPPPARRRRLRKRADHRLFRRRAGFQTQVGVRRGERRRAADVRPNPAKRDCAFALVCGADERESALPFLPRKRQILRAGPYWDFEGVFPPSRVRPPPGFVNNVKNCRHPRNNGPTFAPFAPFVFRQEGGGDADRKREKANRELKTTPPKVKAMVRRRRRASPSRTAANRIFT